ncbi:CFAP61 [Symbiodinium sp. KB8]|nr:CFAP61 [Symbiodinium sp. KB8]
MGWPHPLVCLNRGLVGLSETFLNHLYQRDDDIPDIVEFLADEWATALFHDRFMDFCRLDTTARGSESSTGIICPSGHQIKLEMLTSEEVKQIFNSALENVNLKDGLSRKLLAEIRQKLPKDSVKAIQDVFPGLAMGSAPSLVPGAWAGMLGGHRAKMTALHALRHRLRSSVLIFIASPSRDATAALEVSHLRSIAPALAYVKVPRKCVSDVKMRQESPAASCMLK